MSFDDAPQACPSAAGKLPGRLHGKASITITTTSTSGATTTMRLSADADMSYKVNVGEDGRWTTIDDVDMKTEFQASGTGQTTQTYRGRRLGGGFGRDGILGGSGSDFGKALERDWGKIDPQKGGGVFGPKGGWNWKRGVTLSDLHSIDNVKAMVATWIATDALLLAGVEYLRAVALKRGEKHWYDDEQCMTLTGTATPASLRPEGHRHRHRVEGEGEGRRRRSREAHRDRNRLDRPRRRRPGARWHARLQADRPRQGRRDVDRHRHQPRREEDGLRIGSGRRRPAGELQRDGRVDVHGDGHRPVLERDAALRPRHSRQDNPDGSVTRSLQPQDGVDLDHRRQPDRPAARTYRFTGTGGTIDAGELELQIAADGSRTYGFQADVRLRERRAHADLVPCRWGARVVPARPRQGVPELPHAHQRPARRRA